MNNETIEMTVEHTTSESGNTALAQRHAGSITAPTATPADLLRIAVESGADLDRLEKLMGLQERWEAKEAKRAYDQAFAAFKDEAVVIVKRCKVTDGPLKGKSYAALHDIVNAVTPALSKHGLSSSWKLTRDDKDWMEVTCLLRHTSGHEEYVSMGGPPDAGGAKNAIQARASTKTYLERYTLKAITGLSEQGDDTDGNISNDRDAATVVLRDWLAKIPLALNKQALQLVWKDGSKALNATKDMAAYAEFKGAVEHKLADFHAAGDA